MPLLTLRPRTLVGSRRRLVTHCLAALVALPAALLAGPELARAEDGTAASSSPAAAVDDEYRSLIRELLETTGSLELGKQMADGVVQTMLTSMRASGREISPREATIIQETARELFGEVFGNEQEIVRVQAEIYSKHYAKEELRALLQFYRSPVGAKTIAAMPLIMREGMAYGQAKAQQNMESFQLKLIQRFQAEGLLDEEPNPTSP